MKKGATVSGFAEEHEIFRRSLRAFVEREVTPHVLQWEAAGEVPRELFRKLAQLGYLGVRLSETSGGGGRPDR